MTAPIHATEMLLFSVLLTGFDHWQSTILGSLMNTRALMELIVPNVGYDFGFCRERCLPCWSSWRSARRS
jgi:hypothetical protein